MLLDDPLRDHQPEAEAGVLAADERLEQPWQHPLRNAGTGVGHLQFGPPPRPGADGERHRPAGRHRVQRVQPEVHQHLPQLLAVGNTIELPLALPRSVDRWVYEVVGTETLYAPFGAVDTFHLKPRRTAPPGDLTAEMWFAPALEYLPVRIRINQDAQIYVDMTIERPPLQAAEPYSPGNDERRTPR